MDRTAGDRIVTQSQQRILGMADKYRPTKGASFNKAMAQQLGRILEGLGESPTPKQLVDAARSKSSPIHGLFEWDNTVAAERWRLSQARNHINHLEIVIVCDGERQHTKAYHSVVIATDDSADRCYASAVSVRRSSDLSKQVIATATEELAYWRKRYDEYSRVFSGVFKAADKIIAKNGKPKRKLAKAR